MPQRLVTGTSEQSLSLLVSGTKQPSVHLLPDTPESRGFVKALPQDLFFWQADKASGEHCWIAPCSSLVHGHGSRGHLAHLHWLRMRLPHRAILAVQACWMFVMSARDCCPVPTH